MVHQMWEALFVTTFQNKDNLLIYTKTICKSSYKMQKNIHIQRSFFYLSIYLFVLQLTSHKVIYSAYRKKKLFLSSFLNFFVFLSNSQEKKNTNLFISKYVYLKF